MSVHSICFSLEIIKNTFALFLMYTFIRSLIRAFSDFKAFLYILIGGFAKAANQNIEKGFRVRESSDYLELCWEILLSGALVGDFTC